MPPDKTWMEHFPHMITDWCRAHRYATRWMILCSIIYAVLLVLYHFPA